MGGHLAGGGKGESTACPYAVKVVGGLAVDTALILAFLILVELLEAILGVGIIFDVVALVLLNVTLILEGEGAPRSPAVKMSGFLPVELAFHSATVLRGPEPLKPVVDELCVLLVEILMGHHVRGARIDLVTAHLHAVVVCAFPIQVAAVIVHTAVIQGAEAHEAVLEGIITFLVHVVMPNHILFTSESLVVALWVKAVVMFSVLVCTVYVSTVLAARKPVSTRGQEKGTGNETVS